MNKQSLHLVIVHCRNSINYRSWDEEICNVTHQMEKKIDTALAEKALTKFK